MFRINNDKRLRRELTAGLPTVLGGVYGSLDDMDHALAAYEQAFNLNPNDPQTLALYAEILPMVGRAKEGVEMMNRAFRLNPHHPSWYDLVVDPYYATGAVRASN